MWTEIMPRLFVGTTEIRPRSDLFDTVVTLGPAGTVPPKMRHRFWDLGPSETPDPKKTREIVEWTADRWLVGDRILVRCQDGRNRSAMLAALVIAEVGAKPDEAMEIVRREIPGAIANDYINRITA